MELRIGPWGRRWRAPPPEGISSPAPAPAPTQRQQTQLTCEQCGAVLSYEPGTSQLACQYCGHRNTITDQPIEIVEYDLNDALRRGLDEAPVDEAQVAKCASCGAQFTFERAEHAGGCPFCGQPVVADTGTLRQIRPSAVLPFAIKREDARARVSGWLKGLWFAPSRLQSFARTEGRLAGMYLPYWTYDSHTETDYLGQRGIIYVEPVRVVRVLNGRRVVQTEMVQKVRWQPVSGHVRRHFDDVVVLGSRTLPASITDGLGPWDLHDLRPYSPEYLTGFQSEAYQVALGEGFENAKEKMRAALQGDVAADIGGDLQRIERMEIRHVEPTFKHILLPTWLGAFRYGGKVYRLCINGRSGLVRGERPYSAWKIAVAVLVVAVLVGTFLYFYGQQM
jgi:DNA-directed RNA polymerase subunit RPC12/RpoP